MESSYKIKHLEFLYIFFIFLSLNIFFFSTTKVQAKAFNIDNVEISKPFEINFNKNKVIDDGFNKAFLKLISLIVDSSNQGLIKDIKLNEIKGMIDSFSIKEEKFIDEVYHVNLGVSFNKKEIFNYLEKRNIFPSIPIKKKILFIPIIIDEKTKDLLIFYNNKIFEKWNDRLEDFHLLEYILPTEDLEDLDLVKQKFNLIEQYDFSEITNKYNLKDSIVALIFKNDKEVRILSKISIKENLILKNQSFSNIDINDIKHVNEIIDDLKKNYEDHWKNLNQINTSIRLVLNVKSNNNDNLKNLDFEEKISNKDLIYDYFIYKFDKDFVYYKIIFNGTPDNFLKSMKDDNYYFDTQNKIWILK